MNPSSKPPRSQAPSSSLVARQSRRTWIRSGLTLAAGGLLHPGFGTTTNPAQETSPDGQAPEVLREFLYESAAFPQCHASTIVETQYGLLAAWFGGTSEGHSNVAIYAARRTEQGWSDPRQVADGWVERDGRRYPCWNPVLFQPRGQPLLLFYKVGPKPSSWWGMLKTSTDHGRTWSEAVRLPPGQMGPVRAKPIELPDGTLLCPSSSEEAGWQVHLETSRPPYRTWTRSSALNLSTEWGAIQPTLLNHGRGEIQLLCRSRQRSILEAWSSDEGRTWSRLTRTQLPNPNAGIDAIRLDDRRFLLIYNHARQGRNQLNLALTNDGRRWLAAHVLENEPGEYSYPAAILDRQGLVHLTYTWKRTRIRHVVVDPARLSGAPIENGQWPGWPPLDSL